MMPITRQTLGSQDFPENLQKKNVCYLFRCQQKDLQKTLPPPPEILKNPQKTLPRPPKTFKKVSWDRCLKVLARKSNRMGAPPSPLSWFLKAKTHKNLSWESFLKILGDAGKFFEGFFKMSGGGGAFFDGFLLG